MSETITLSENENGIWKKVENNCRECLEGAGKDLGRRSNGNSKFSFRKLP